MVTVRVPAKINLALGVGPLRDDGYHPLATVYQAIDLHDEVSARAVDDGSIGVHVQVDESLAEDVVVPDGDDNLAVRAARLLREETGVDDGVELAIRKVIPVAGGMAGGSADAAGALVACNELWGTGLDRAELEQLAAQLGSDVPFLLHGGTAIGGGRGETISPVLAKGSHHWVVAVADKGLSTPAVFGELDRLRGTDLPEPSVSEELLAALRLGDPTRLGLHLSNDLTDAALSLRPELAETLAVGREAGALGSLLSGSGPTTLFLASDERHAMDLAVALAAARVCADVMHARGPVPGARIV